MKKLLIFMLCLLAPLTDLKVGDIQPVEIFLLLAVFVFVLTVILKGFSVYVIKDLWHLEKQYIYFIFFAVVVSISALRLDFYPPSDISFLKGAPTISFARAFQVGVFSSAMILIANFLSRDRGLLEFFAKSYVLIGIFNGLYGILSWFLLKYFGIDMGGAYEVDVVRSKGFFVEGGPFGIYLLSVLLVILFWLGVLRPSRFGRYALFFIIGFALILTSSKAALLGGATMAIWYAAMGRSFRPLYLIILLAIPVLFLTEFMDRLFGYIISYASFSALVAANPQDLNLITGRVMAMHLVPIMITHHPILGIGLGNYSLMRNNPEYLQGLPATDVWDLPGLGLFAYAAELGIPLFLFVLFLLWKPVRMVRHKHAPKALVLIAAFQFFAHGFGVQLNFIYPWMLTAMALGYVYGAPVGYNVKSYGFGLGLK